MNMERNDTNRGFALYQFTDRSGAKCSLQKSSLAFEDAIWLGVMDANAQVMASEAESVGVLTRETTGWVPYPIPEKVLLTTRMHLTQEQVVELLPLLQHFAETGELPE
ncbi:TPA: hypothetical protein L4V19_002220 [Pseudomonas aeruginosa]|nr:hypothetical protein [Pseudomonas aeruginosa]